jgi:hypothetical protein
MPWILSSSDNSRILVLLNAIWWPDIIRDGQLGAHGNKFLWYTFPNPLQFLKLYRLGLYAASGIKMHLI